MKTKRKSVRARARGFNFIDLLIVVVTVLLFFTVALPWFGSRGSRVKTSKIGCVNNLKQIGLAYRLWANDNNGSFPMSVSTDKAGTMEYNETGQVFRHFLAMSNELGTPRVLACPEDKQRTRMTNWLSGFSNQNISYFVGLEANDTKPQTILSGDRNITGGIPTNGNIMLFTNNALPQWTTAIHNKAGNIGLGDGSVQQLSDQNLQKQLQAEFQSVTNTVIRFAIP